MEGDLSGSDPSILLIHLVSNENNGDVLANAGKILVLLGDVLVGDAARDVEHDDSTVGSNIVALTKPAQLLLAGGIPKVELDGSVVGVEDDAAHIDTLSGWIK